MAALVQFAPAPTRLVYALLLAGLAATSYGLHANAIVYGLAVAALSITALSAQRLRGGPVSAPNQIHKLRSLRRAAPPRTRGSGPVGNPGPSTRPVWTTRSEHPPGVDNPVRFHATQASLVTHATPLTSPP
jgi:hypothetical protein